MIALTSKLLSGIWAKLAIVGGVLLAGLLLAILAGGLILAWRSPQQIGDFLRSLPPLVQEAQ